MRTLLSESLTSWPHSADPEKDIARRQAACGFNGASSQTLHQVYGRACLLTFPLAHSFRNEAVCSAEVSLPPLGDIQPWAPGEMVDLIRLVPSFTCPEAKWCEHGHQGPSGVGSAVSSAHPTSHMLRPKPAHLPAGARPGVHSPTGQTLPPPLQLSAWHRDQPRPRLDSLCP